mgnify:CR=1 FL=1
MTNFGRFRLSYDPGPYDPYSGCVDHSVEMSISGEAELRDLVKLFESFLRANGYTYEGKLDIVNPVSSYPYGGDTMLYGATGNDTISIG